RCRRQPEGDADITHERQREERTDPTRIEPDRSEVNDEDDRNESVSKQADEARRKQQPSITAHLRASSAWRAEKWDILRMFHFLGIRHGVRGLRWRSKNSKRAWSARSASLPLKPWPAPSSVSNSASTAEALSFSTSQTACS